MGEKSQGPDNDMEFLAGEALFEKKVEREEKKKSSHHIGTSFDRVVEKKR